MTESFFTTQRYRLMAITILVIGALWIGASAAPPGETTKEKISAPRTGFTAPDFTLSTPDGEVFTLSKLRGRTVIVNLWASWCGPCRAEMPALQRVHEAYKDAGLVILAVNATNQDSKTAALAFATEHGLTFPILLDLDGQVSQQYELRALPSTYFIRPNGIIEEVVTRLGPLALQTPGLILLLGFWLGLNLAERHAPRFKIHPDQLYNLAFLALITGVLGARLTFAARFPSAFVASPASLISLNPGLFDVLGGVATSLVAALIYGQRKKIAFWPALDSFTPLFSVMAVAIGLANLASGNGFGAETSLPWAIELWGTKRHPTQIYETFAALGILTLLWPGRGLLARRATNPGSFFLLFLTLSAFSRLFLEAYREDSATLPNGWRVAQILAWTVLAGGLWGLERISKSAIYQNNN
ncbi:MAG TPA: prolipoprotein diacylglyceryl transferase family protein [Anaerolineales bacterium]|nr:prolipoprotein diacylglyceryl transferase family protein [Anaerolineales bacterium]